jgi:hypothetical protein
MLARIAKRTGLRSEDIYKISPHKLLQRTA